jgi:hypothetical protein
MTTNWATLINWIVTGLLGVIFGAASAWVAYRYQRKRDDIKWKREKEQRQEELQQYKEKRLEEWQQAQKTMQIQWEHEQQELRKKWDHDKDLLFIQSEERLKLFEQQVIHEENNRIREELLVGLENPAKTIAELEQLKMNFEMKSLNEIADFELKSRNEIADFSNKSSDLLESLWREPREIQELGNRMDNINKRLKNYEDELQGRYYWREALNIWTSRLFWIMVVVAVLLIANLIMKIIMK